METHRFKLISGVECEIGIITGKAREINFNQAYIKDGSVIPRLLKELVKRVGSETNIRFNVSKHDQDQSGFDVLDLLAEDANQILVQAHLFDMDMDSTFVFENQFDGVKELENGDIKKYTFEQSIQIDLSGIEYRSYKIPVYEGNVLKWLYASDLDSSKSKEDVEKQYLDIKEYKEVLQWAKKVPFYFEKMDKQFTFDMLTLRQQFEFEKKKLKTTINSPLLIRNVCETIQDTSKLCDIDNMKSSSLNAIQNFIKNCEGKYDMLVKMINPVYNEDLPQSIDNQKEVFKHLLALPDFLSRGVAR